MPIAWWSGQVHWKVIHVTCSNPKPPTATCSLAQSAVFPESGIKIKQFVKSLFIVTPYNKQIKVRFLSLDWGDAYN